MIPAMPSGRAGSCWDWPSYDSSDTRKWIRIRGRAEAESSPRVREEMMEMYSNLRRAYTGGDEMYLAVYRLLIDDVSIT